MGVPLDTSTLRPSGRDQITTAVLSATERLCATGQPSSFTVKDIAREAGVTTSLLYFYFDSKDDIVVATLRSIASTIDAAAASAGGPQEMATEVSRFLVDRPAFARILAWLILEGRSVTEEMGDHPFLRRLMMTFATDQVEDPHTQAGVVVTKLLSNAFFHRGVNVAIGREENDERLIRALDQWMGRASAFPSEGREA